MLVLGCWIAPALPLARVLPGPARSLVRFAKRVWFGTAAYLVAESAATVQFVGTDTAA